MVSEAPKEARQQGCRQGPGDLGRFWEGYGRGGERWRTAGGGGEPRSRNELFVTVLGGSGAEGRWRCLLVIMDTAANTHRVCAVGAPRALGKAVWCVLRVQQGGADVCVCACARTHARTPIKHRGEVWYIRQVMYIVPCLCVRTRACMWGAVWCAWQAA